MTKSRYCLLLLEDFKANVPPEQPSEALITQLAAAKGLDPKPGDH
ncbi:DUF6396 domain-containing protein [Vogesella sp. LIG4]|nr:DUF6396 domain-containing protein [Vogesella sp. LIG4]SCK25418.1 hypothetical protein PSELUDRAFT_3021 [Vogesella sp. LIG4]